MNWKDKLIKGNNPEKYHQGELVKVWSPVMDKWSYGVLSVVEDKNKSVRLWAAWRRTVEEAVSKAGTGSTFFDINKGNNNGYKIEEIR